MTSPQFPAFDDNGNNIADPKDRSGRKMAYVTLVQQLALEKHVGRGPGTALDLGCGYGRISRVLQELDWTVVGVEPSRRILNYAPGNVHDGIWCQGGLPSLPFVDESFDLILAQNLLRPMHLSGILDVVRSDALAALLKPNARLVVVDNIWPGNPRFITDAWIRGRFMSANLRLTKRVAIRSARWWGVIAVQLGLVPRTWAGALARHELRRMSRKQADSRWRYHNVMYIFRK